MKKKKTKLKIMNDIRQEIDLNVFLEHSISDILEKLKSKEISPKEIAEVCINRIEEYNERFKVWVCYSEEILFEQSEIISERINAGFEIRNLEGIPVGIKDIFNTNDFPTQMGSPLWKDFTPGNDARIVYYLKESGAVIPGKTDTAEFAVHAIGNCLNPHDITRTPGTSSSGSAVAVALGMVPAAVGTQTAGSIVRPASFCGVYGCKPSFGLIPRTGMLKTTDSLDTIGFFTSKYTDLQTLFEIIRVHGDNYPLSNNALTDEKRQNKTPGKPWRVAFVKTHTWDNAFDYAKDSITDFIKRVNEITEIEAEEAELPAGLENSHHIHETIYDKTLSYYFSEELQKPELISPVMNEIFKRGNKITVEEYHKALRDQEIVTKLMDRFFDNYDVIISLSTAGVAPLREETERPDPSLIWTLTHLPVVCAPAFVSPEGLPFGIQFAARKYNDKLLFRFTDLLRNSGLIPEGTNPLPQV
ncbi:MAG TPA: amidase [Ignavibacteria bacterium]|nr:amidase [Ignavibacteria bacterium]